LAIEGPSWVVQPRGLLARTSRFWSDPNVCLWCDPDGSRLGRLRRRSGRPGRMENG